MTTPFRALHHVCLVVDDLDRAVAYYESVAGKRKLVHLKGLVVPGRCPAGGFPTAGTVDFQDGSTLTVNSSIPCPPS